MLPNKSLDGARGARVNVACIALALALVGAAPTAAGAEPIRLLAFGDSLVAGYGLAEEDGFTARLEAALGDAGYDVEVVNGGVSGDTTAGGVARLDWALFDRPDMVLLELGANDALRGVDPAVSRANLATMLDRLNADGVPTLLAGMLAPRNWGSDYAAAFDPIYPDLAAEYGVALYPFFLDGVAADPAFNQPDGIHPNAAGVDVIVDGILPYIIDVIDEHDLVDGQRS